MPRIATPLTDTKIRSAQPAAKNQYLFDGNGLFLIVTPKGKKFWRFKYRFDSKPGMLSMGEYPTVSLRMARERRDDALRLLDQGENPSVARRIVSVVVPVVATKFSEVFNDFMNHTAAHLAPTTKAKILNSMERHALPMIGEKPVDSLSTDEILTCIRRIEAQGSLEMARRVRAWISRCFRYAIITGKCQTDPAANLRGALRVPVIKHHASLPVDQLPAFLAALDDPLCRLYPLTRLALKLLLLTGVRPGELRYACWNEFDITTAEWRIPPERMKMRTEHVVPLATQTLGVIETIGRFSGDRDVLFPAQGQSNGVLSENTLGKAAKTLGFAVTAHGFRSTFSTYLNESEQWSGDAIEAQLAHKPVDAVRSAYYRGNRRLEERRRMMQWWADELDRLRSSYKRVETNIGDRSPKQIMIN